MATGGERVSGLEIDSRYVLIREVYPIDYYCLVAETECAVTSPYLHEIMDNLIHIH